MRWRAFSFGVKRGEAGIVSLHLICPVFGGILAIRATTAQDISTLGDDLRGEFLLSAWHWLPPLVCSPLILSLDVVPSKGGRSHSRLGVRIDGEATRPEEFSPEAVAQSAERLQAWAGSVGAAPVAGSSGGCGPAQ